MNDNEKIAIRSAAGTTEEGNWEDFETWVSKLKVAVEGKNATKFLFRGQANPDWKLQTTLERETIGIPVSLAGYENLILEKIGPELQGLANISVPKQDQGRINSYQEMDTLLKQFLPDEDGFQDQLSQYMIYLRHHGFPSPLLDWSRSQYIAAFFAFRDEPKSNVGKEVQYRSIYAYCERPTGGKSGSASMPTLYVMNGNVPAHHRHFRQQSVYTICLSFNESQLRYESHQVAFSANNTDQDLFWRFNIHSSEKKKVLRKLDEYNLNAYSLMGTEESLLETKWVREREWFLGK
jgi:hypothetical protein